LGTGRTDYFLVAVVGLIGIPIHVMVEKRLSSFVGELLPHAGAGIRSPE
jgi:hypothetical protein